MYSQWVLISLETGWKALLKKNLIGDKKMFYSFWTECAIDSARNFPSQFDER